MCLAIPGAIEAIYDRQGLRMAKVDFSGIKREICLHYVPQAVVGDYVLVHVGFAIATIDEEEARQTLRLQRIMGEDTEFVGEEP